MFCQDFVADRYALQVGVSAAAILGAVLAIGGTLIMLRQLAQAGAE